MASMPFWSEYFSGGTDKLPSKGMKNYCYYYYYFKLVICVVLYMIFVCGSHTGQGEQLQPCGPGIHSDSEARWVVQSSRC